MRLSSIKLSGFKSFVDPTNFQVPGQLVGVVGPNGCGKSNIIDAVRWVLGESKASELRGESMQDVIFNGSTHRKPAGRSSVELTFDNNEGKVAGQWGQYAEISVKRTLTRDGTSSYYINNQAVRRRDIQDIFLGTGLGPRAYAIIGQGMISRIIEARPEELRIFLEEAAGVSKYKERRRETENRLNDTRENLTRLEDILRELNNNLEKLEAQAEVAQRFHALSADQEEKQKLLWLLRRNEARAEQEKVFREIERGQIELEQNTAGMRHIEAELEQLRQTHYASGDRLHQAQGALYQTNAEIGSLEAQIKFVVESRSRLQTQLASLQTQREQWMRQSHGYQQELADAEMHLEELAERTHSAQETAEQLGEQLPTLEQNWREAQQRTQDGRSGISEVQQQIALESTHQRNASNILNSLTGRRERLEQEKRGLELPDDTRLTNLRWQLQEKQAQLEELAMQLEELQTRQPELEQQRADAQQRLNTESGTYTQLEARLGALRTLQGSVQSQGKVQPWLDRHELGELPRLWKKLSIAQGWETALEAVLRERTGALEMSNLDWARAFFQDPPPARMALYSLGSVAAGTGADVAAGTAAPVGMKPFIGLLNINEPGLRALMQDWLAQLYQADDVESAFARRSQLPSGGAFVTQAGHIVSRSSVRFYASDSEQDGMLARQQEIANLDKQIRAQQMLAEEARSQLVRAEAALSGVTQKLQEYRPRHAVLTQSVHTQQIEVLKQEDLAQRISQRSTQIADDLADISQQESEQLQIRNESEARFEQLDLQLATLQEAHESHQTGFLDIERRLEDGRQRLRDSERGAQEAAYAERTHRNRIEELHRHISTAAEQSGKLLESHEQGTLELESMNDESAQHGLQDLLDRRTDQESRLADARQEMDQLSQRLRQHEEGRLQSERGLQPLRDRITELQLKEQAARLNQEQYNEQLTNFKADEQALSEKLNDDLKPSYLQGEVTRLGNAITALGAVNLAALDELATSSERKRFLDEQNADLLDAINTLESAIHTIDKESRDLLQDTFDKVNHHFAELFPILFGGGQARLIMTGDEILDSGVQVMAQPPGKKNATIHLLSGGEKALTATALIFSMFQLNPAPFCLLDEVDAPLDDANTERFCNMVKRMASHTQFLFISHNKIAMEMANQLIGVTMQEQGVSRIVAVDMEGAHNLIA